MLVLIDTSVAVDLINERREILDRVREVEGLYLSVISNVELEAGVYRDGSFNPIFRSRLDKLLARTEQLQFTEREVVAYASIIAAKGFSRRLIVDRMIAATALANDLVLATPNPRDFRDITELTIEDWSTGA